MIPDAAVKDAKCTDYVYDKAPTICLEGQNNSHGSHGRAHISLKDAMIDYNGPGEPPKPAPNDNELIKHAVAYFPDDEEGERWSLGTLEGFDVSFGEIAQKPLVQHVVSVHGQVYAAGSGIADIEKSIPSGEDIRRLQGGEQCSYRPKGISLMTSRQ